jgi:hypothetical protein
MKNICIWLSVLQPVPLALLLPVLQHAPWTLAAREIVFSAHLAQVAVQSHARGIRKPQFLKGASAHSYGGGVARLTSVDSGCIFKEGVCNGKRSGKLGRRVRRSTKT